MPTSVRQAAFACLLCGGEESRASTRRADMSLRSCAGCGFVQQHPLPTEAEVLSMYAEEESYCLDLERGVEIFLERDRAILADLARRGAGGPLLDVGAGAGVMLRAALERGWGAAGIEPCVGGTWGACSIAPVVEACDGADEDCDGATDEGLLEARHPDADGDGFGAEGSVPTWSCAPASGSLM